MVAATQQSSNAGYEVIKANTYAQGVAKLREAGAQPKTFEENIRARVEVYESNDRQLFQHLWNENWLDSCTAIVNKARSTKVKLVLKSEDLMAIPSDFRGSYLAVEYNNLKGEGVFELDYQKNGLFDRSLLKDNVLGNDGWRLAVQDASLLKTYREIVFAQLKEKHNRDTGMRFYVRQNTDQDELRALFVRYLNNYSNAYGISDLYSNGSFLRGSPAVGAAGARVGKTGSAHRDPAMTKEQMLELKVAEALSPFDKYVGTVNQEQYRQDKQQATKELLALLKK
ncbi:MAG: hypothetical protein Q7S55_02610 [Nanoarchaeota archaeon]|nr:hypothetical protein [Nanoarchaeota archaeon]